MSIVDVKIFKSYSGRAGRREQWSNSYSLNTDLQIGSTELDDLCMELVSMEKGIHHTSVSFMSMVISTHEREGRGVVGTNTRSVELTGTGVQLQGGNPLESLDHTLLVKYSARTGRSGGCFYRGILADVQVSIGPGGMPVASTDIVTNTQSALNTFKGTDAFAALVLPHSTSNDGTPFRGVTDITVSGVSPRKRHVNRKRKKEVNANNVLTILKDSLPELIAVASWYTLNRASVSPALATAIRAAIFPATVAIGQLPSPDDND
jgi:hypothetical protein